VGNRAQALGGTLLAVADIGLNLMRIRADAARKANTLDILAAIEGSLEAATKELRAFTYLLHPPDLQGEGLSATLGRYVEGFGTRTGLKIKVHSSRSVDELSLPLQLTLLRIVQEALTNVHRHASATRVSVKCRRVGKRMVLAISDDGQTAEKAAGHQSGKHVGAEVGVPEMIARMQQLGGNLQISSGPNGTAVRATVPVR
jgi:two-component system, NarL family, sensor kinase